MFYRNCNKVCTITAHITVDCNSVALSMTTDRFTPSFSQVTPTPSPLVDPLGGKLLSSNPLQLVLVVHVVSVSSGTLALHLALCG